MEQSSIKYSTVIGVFLQSESSINASEFDYTKSNFGLIERHYETDDQCPTDATSWQRFACYVEDLNKKSPSTVRYKVIFLARHGQGDHNVAEAKYGTAAWDDYWSKLDGADGLTFFDAHLTDEGLRQAKVANAVWKHQLTVEKTPSPQSFYTSPLYRCLQTAEATFDDPRLPLSHPFKPHVKELLREVIGEHTCDRRSPLSVLRTAFPGAVFDPDFADTDPLWTAAARETPAQLAVRLQRLLDDVFARDGSVWVSFTAHSGAIQALLWMVGHREFALGTGAVVPVLVRGESRRGDGGGLAG